MSARTLLTWATALMLAGFSAATSLSSALARKAPATAVAIPFSSGTALERLAGRLVRADFTPESGAQPSKLDSVTVDSAKRAFKREPLTTTAIRILAYQKLLDDDLESGRALISIVARLTKRDEAAGMWLVEDASRRGDGTTAVRNLDLVMRSSGDRAKQLIPALIEVLKRPDAVPIFTELLAGPPPWAGDFWLAVTEDQGALPNAYALRTRLLAKGWGYSGTSDQRLLYALIEAGDVDAAYELANEFFGPSDAIVTNGDFSESPRRVPFDWGLVTAESYGAALDLPQKKLVASATTGSGGVIASQLIRIGSGRYALELDGAGFAENEEAVASVELRCVNGGPAVLAENLQERESRFTFTVASTNCGYYWLRLIAVPPKNPDGADFDIQRVALVPLS